MTDKQVHRETKGRLLAFRAAIQSQDLRGWTIVMRNDATGALATLRKGSSASSELQRTAMEFSVLARDAGVDTVFLHAPGADLIREEIDAASRDGAISLKGPAVTPDTHSTIHDCAAAVGWRISIDLFATRENSISQ